MNNTQEFITNRNNSDWAIKQSVENNEIILICDHLKNEDFERFTIGNRHNSPCWISVSMEKIKNNRRTEISFQIDKKQFELFIENLQGIKDAINY